MGKVTSFIRAIVAAMLVAFSLIGCNKSDFIIVVEAPTSVYEDYPKGGPPTAKVIAILEKGETKEVLQTRYAKDCEYLKIRLQDGRTGYVGWDGKYNVVPKTSDVR
jgi:uncharacterized lipoprotein NlpE involved in copper resistance